MNDMKLDNLRTLLIEDLMDLYDAERQITEALPQMIKAASTPELKSSLEDHLKVTQRQHARLEKVFKKLGVEAEGKTCDGMKGLLKEGQKVLGKQADPDVKDAAIIAAAQKVEHYEIAAYGTARTYARMLGDMDAALLLEQTLDEEGQTDQKLTKLAEYHVNPKAAGVA
jgi:ferritin-like metal-binding protein YciE